MTLTKGTARDVVDALRNGTVPQGGLHEYAVGLDRHMEAMEEQLERVAAGRGQVKFVRGEYGAGKTFVTHLLMETALRKRFVVSDVVISKDTPLHKMEEVYHEIVANLTTPRRRTTALKDLLDRWIHRAEDRLIRVEGFAEHDPRLVERTHEEIEARLGGLAAEHSAFAAVLRAYYEANVRDDDPLAQQLLGWLSGEKNVSAQVVRRAAGVKGGIDQTMVFSFIRALAEISHQAGRHGLVVVLDEVETITRLARRDMREQGLQNVRQIVDAVDEGRLPRCYFVLTGTPSFYDDPKGVPALPPLDERIRLEDPNDPFPNYSQAQVALRPFDREKLLLVGGRIREIYEVAYGPLDRSRASDGLLESLADRLTDRFGGRVEVVPRQFLRQLVDKLDRIRVYEDYRPEETLEDELSRQLKAGTLTPVEEEFVVF
jgi:adenosylhomocysteinase